MIALLVPVPPITVKLRLPPLSEITPVKIVTVLLGLAFRRVALSASTILLEKLVIPLLKPRVVPLLNIIWPVPNAVADAATSQPDVTN
jgi:hypothetical protein